jgi:hypothetical protein
MSNRLPEQYAELVSAYVLLLSKLLPSPVILSSLLFKNSPAKHPCMSPTPPAETTTSSQRHNSQAWASTVRCLFPVLLRLCRDQCVLAQHDGMATLGRNELSAAVWLRLDRHGTRCSPSSMDGSQPLASAMQMIKRQHRDSRNLPFGHRYLPAVRPAPLGSALSLEAARNHPKATLPLTVKSLGQSTASRSPVTICPPPRSSASAE